MVATDYQTYNDNFAGKLTHIKKFKNALRTEPIQILIRQYMERNTEDVNISLENAMKILTESSKLCLKIKAKKTYKRIKKSSNKKWFDCECRLKRHELRKVSNETVCDKRRLQTCRLAGKRGKLCCGML